MSKAQKGNKENKKPKADKTQTKANVSAYKVAQGQGKPASSPFAKKGGRGLAHGARIGFVLADVRPGAGLTRARQRGGAIGAGGRSMSAYLRSRRNFVHRSERRQVPIAT
jgi:hypothetical protein